MSDQKKELAQKLLDAQVEFFMEQLTGEDFEKIVEEELDKFFDDIEDVTLGEVVTSDQIKQVVKKYVKEVEIHGAIPELMGEIAEHVYDLPVHDTNKVGDLVSDEQFEVALEKALEMEDLRKRAIGQIVANPVYSDLVSDLLYSGIKDYISDNPVTKNVPGAASMLKFGKSMMNKAAPNLEAAIEENVKKFIKKNASKSLKQSEKFLNKTLSNEKISEISQDAWEKIKGKKISTFREAISAADLQDFLVLGYEFWLELREVSYTLDVLDSGIDFFFSKYGDSTLRLILEEVSIKKEMLTEEAMLFAPPAIEVLKENGVLEKVLRRRLEPFFFSEKALALL
ncbi:MAG: hypothetical protein COA99_11360 [Moraxellaceae bacterium]|nr:MAG: hypothetical protein COA99_11360 [Moraxellaceae bacterium]